MAGVTKEGILQTTSGGGGGSSTVSIGAPINATDAAVMNTVPLGTEYGVAVRLVGATGGGGPATIANGADVNAGATTDAAVITDTTGTLSGKLRGLVKWAFERMPASLGQKTSVNSFPVVIASDQSSIPVTGTFFQATQPVSATNLDIRDLLFATDKVDASGSAVSITGTVTTTGGLTDAQLRATPVPISAASLPLPTGAATSALQTAGNVSLASIDTDIDVALSTRASEATLATRLADATFTSRINTLGQKTAANSTPVVLASDQSSIPVSATETRPATSSVTSVASSATNVTLLASNANRRLGTIFNESTQILYLKFGATASLTSYTVQVGPSGYYEIPQPVYTGIIDGLWAAANGSARITELT